MTDQHNAFRNSSIAQQSNIRITRNIQRLPIYHPPSTRVSPLVLDAKQFNLRAQLPAPNMEMF